MHMSLSLSLEEKKIVIRIPQLRSIFNLILQENKRFIKTK